MTPSRPYLVRAIYEWLVDNNATPYVLLDATLPGVRVPVQYVKDGKIVLNVAPHAVKEFFVRNEDISFSARFNGVAMVIEAPMKAVLAIYARENGQGMFFDNNTEFPADDEENLTGVLAPHAELSAVPTAPAREAADDKAGDSRPTPPAGGRPSLRVVK